MIYKWPAQPFERCFDYIAETDRVLHLSIQGLSLITRMPPLARVLTKFIPEQDQDLKETEACAKFAQEEIDKGFPILHAHALTSLWGALDALITDLASVWLLNEPSVLARDQFAKLKIPLAEYELLGKENRMSFLVKELTRSLNADFKLGIGKFEVILEALGLVGEVEEDVRRTLLEMSQVRNVLVHRAGTVDRRFKESCPWVEVEVGSRLRIDHARYVRYSKAMHDYVLCLINRVRVHFGIEPFAEESVTEDSPNSDST